MTQGASVRYPYGMSPVKRPRSARFDMRCPPNVREILEAAAEKAQESLTTFLLRAGISRARNYLGGQQKAFDDAERALNPFFTHR